MAALLRRGSALAAMLSILSGCADGVAGRGVTSADRGVGGTVDGTAMPAVESSLEAPEVFQQTETGLWDGRPSLGGIWVAHPDVTEPQRVIIRNVAAGTSVTGALFRRERENPGPRFQISSEAAERLGLLAGQPAELNVTALRRADPADSVEEDAAAPPPSPAADPPTETEVRSPGVGPGTTTPDRAAGLSEPVDPGYEDA